MIRVLVDADSCARRVRNYLLSRAKKNQIELYFIANKNILAGQDAGGQKASQAKEAGGGDQKTSQDQNAGSGDQKASQAKDAGAAPLPANVKMVVCPKESQAADKWILENALSQDLVITRDIPLAAALLEKNIRVINDFGKVFDKKNADRALKERALSLQMTELGLSTKRRDNYGQKEFEAFAECFNKEAAHAAQQ